MLETIGDFDKYKPAVRARLDGNAEFRDSNSFGSDALAKAAQALCESTRKLGILKRIENAVVTYDNKNE